MHKADADFPFHIVFRKEWEGDLKARFQKVAMDSLLPGSCPIKLLMEKRTQLSLGLDMFL